MNVKNVIIKYVSYESLSSISMVCVSYIWIFGISTVLLLSRYVLLSKHLGNIDMAVEKFSK